MRTIGWGELRDSVSSKVTSELPCALSVNSQVVAVIADPGKCVLLDGLHPRMIAKIKAMEQLGRAGQASV